MLPVHWGLFALAYHGWTEPVERTVIAADASATPLVTPRPGEAFDPLGVAVRERWWPSLPFETAAEHPIRSTQVD